MKTILYVWAAGIPFMAGAILLLRIAGCDGDPATYCKLRDWKWIEEKIVEREKIVEKVVEVVREVPVPHAEAPRPRPDYTNRTGAASTSAIGNVYMVEPRSIRCEGNYCYEVQHVEVR